MMLEEFGFTSELKKKIPPAALAKGWKPCRVTAVHKGWCDISDGTDFRPAKTTGKLRRIARTTRDYLTVGDWVLAASFDQGDFAVIHHVLPRTNALKRKVAGKEVAHQLIAANIDTAFVVHTLDKGFNLPKLERYLSIVYDSGIHPVILLSKKDLPEPELLKERIDAVARRMPTVTAKAFSNTSGEGLSAVQELFRPGETHCLIGASGVGKTSLINSLVGEEDRYFTLPVRESDGKGVHTTTWRELMVLDNGALVIDTPGMRELGHLNTEVGIHETFDEIEALKDQCRFRDCSHIKTKGCAVMQAVEDGRIDPKRYESFVRMKRELMEADRALKEQAWKNK